MSAEYFFRIPRFQKLGVRLNIILLGTIIFFLVSSGYGIWTLQQQSAQFKAVTQTYYERAMLAAELSRDAELIATQAMEQSVTQKLGNIDTTILQADFTRIFTVAREKLTAETTEEVETLAEIDRLTSPYFGQLILFYQLSERQQRLELDMDSLNRARQQIIKPLLNIDFSSAPSRFSNLAVSHSHSSQAYLEASSPGLIARRQSQLKQLQERLMSIEGLTVNQQETRNALIDNILQTVSLKNQLHKTNLETLSAMRTTRLYAQRLSSVCYDFYLMVKNRAEQASLQHSQLIERVNIQIALFSAAFLGLIGLAYWFIHHFIVRRLNHISAVMQKYAMGSPEPIPQSGHDEITVIGKTFAQFVQANNVAHEETQNARKIAEQANQQLRELNNHLNQQNNTDELTQIPNRRYFFNWLQASYENLAKHNSSLGILMIDIDWFKSFNDHYGHQAGDECLRHVAYLLQHVSKDYAGMLARYGGEEFIVAVPDVTINALDELGRTLLSAIDSANIAHGYTPFHHVTISVGASYLEQANLDMPVERLISRADQALYEAKSKGRSQIAHYIHN